MSFNRSQISFKKERALRESQKLFGLRVLDQRKAMAVIRKDIRRGLDENMASRQRSQNSTYPLNRLQVNIPNLNSSVL